jgi:hypothetical protein
MCKNRIELKVKDNIAERLELLATTIGITSQSVLLCALAQFEPQIQVTEKPKPKAKPKKEKTLGEGNKPKNLQEVVAFFESKNICKPIEPKATLFFDYYQSKGWVVGRSPIKHWGSCITTWLKNNPDWRPVPSVEKETVSIKSFLKWAEAERPPIFEKYRLTTDINDVDQLYIDEFADNNQ